MRIFDRLMSHLYYFVTEFSLINDKEFKPLKEISRRICTDRAVSAAEEKYNAAVVVDVDKVIIFDFSHILLSM